MQPDSEEMLDQFNRLIEELLTGQLQRTRFAPWEMALLLDIESVALTGAARKRQLRGYQSAVQRQLQRGASHPRSFSEHLRALEARGGGRKPPAAEAAARASRKTGTE